MTTQSEVSSSHSKRLGRNRSDKNSKKGARGRGGGVGFGFVDVEMDGVPQSSGHQNGKIWDKFTRKVQQDGSVFWFAGARASCGEFAPRPSQEAIHSQSRFCMAVD